MLDIRGAVGKDYNLNSIELLANRSFPSISEIIHFPALSRLQRHTCYLCQKSYKYSRHLTAHLKYECGRVPGFTCNQCGKKFHYNYTLNAHRRRVHLAERKRSL
ncbi:hypothetical protein HUJ04_008565 [Dendroctonus ponderosae]|nr:hypothetical protein HUJ04_008565 [Dendroctonus ponderosae]